MGTACATLEWDGLEELRPLLRQNLARSCNDEHDLDDVIQETLLRAARYRGGLSDPERLAQWVVRIGRNVCRDRSSTEWRRRRRTAEDELLEALPSPETASEEAARDERVMKIRGEEIELETALRFLGLALEELRARDVSLLHSHYAAGRSCRESAALFGLPEGLVKVRLFRARRRLGRAVERLVVRARLARLEAVEGVA